MFENQHRWRWSSPKIKLELRRFLITKKYFYSRGKSINNYDWLRLYQLVGDLRLIFRLKYSSTSKQLSVTYLPHKRRWTNQMAFFKVYLKWLEQYKWTKLNPDKLFSYVKAAKRACYLALVKQQR